MTIPPLAILGLGIAAVIGLILVLRLNAFLALIVSALLVSLLAPGPVDQKASRVATAFGVAAGNIGVVIALAAIIGTCMMDSGAADRIVRAFVRLLGEKRSSVALMGSGYVLAVPVFFDTVFYLLVPLGRSLYRRTGGHYLKYLLAIAAGGAITHTLVPPTPGPLAMAETLDIDLGWMIMIGALVALPAAVVGLVAASWFDRAMPIPMRPVAGQKEPEPLPDHELPSLFASALPVVLPVLLISANTVLQTLAGKPDPDAPPTALRRVADVAALLGNANFALLLSAVAAMLIYARRRRPTRDQMAALVETSLMSAGVIILITAAGGAFGAMLKEAQIGPAIEDLFGSGSDPGGGRVTGLMLLVLGFAVSSVLKVAQGSSTVAMITASGMLAAMVPSASALGYHPVYLATAIGSGSLVGSWMNDSGFWIFARMGGLTEAEALKSWTPLLVLMGFSGLAVSALLATVLPLL